MYWPIGTPRIYATSSSRAPDRNLFVSYDGLDDQDAAASSTSSLVERTTPRAAAAAAAAADIDVDLQTPPTPMTPLTPAIEPVEQDQDESEPAVNGSSAPSASPDSKTATRQDIVPIKDPVLAMRVARTGAVFAVATATSITLWQTKVRTR